MLVVVSEFPAARQNIGRAFLGTSPPKRFVAASGHNEREMAGDWIDFANTTG
jgi:hypothetical protein